MAFIRTDSQNALAFLPVYSSAPWKETLGWVTDILPNRDGSESRLALRAVPSRVFTAQPQVPHKIQQDVFNTVFGGLMAGWIVPLWHDAQVMRVIDVDQVIPVSTATGDWYVGQIVLFYQSPTKWTSGVIQSLAGGITLAAPVGMSFTSCLVVPMRAGQIMGVPNYLTTGFGASWNLQFELTSNVNHTGAAPAQFLGNDIYYDEALGDENGTLSVSVLTDVDRVDYGVGPNIQTSAWEFNRTTRSYNQTAENAVDAWALRQWLHRRQGRYRPFWQPSFENDLRVASSGALSANLIVEEDSRFAWDQKRTHIAVQKKDGTWQSRTIESFTQLPGNLLQLGLDSALVGNYSDIAVVCNLGLRRLDSDSVDLNWIGNSVCQMSVATVEIQP